MTNPYGPQDGQSSGQQPSYGAPSYGAPSYGQPTPPSYDSTPGDGGVRDGVPGAPPAPPYGAPSPYAASSYATTPYATYGGQPQQNQMALIALICSLAGLITGLSVIAGIVCGHIALSQLRQNPQQTGRGMAVAALWVGYGLLVLGIVAIVAYIALFAAVVGSSSY